MERRVRLGDVIDDYCTRCRRLMNHGIVGMVGNDVAKVRCNTCQSEHAFKHGRLPKRRRGETDRLFAEVLRGIRGEPEAPEDSGGSGEDRAAPPADEDDAPAAAVAAGRDRDDDAEDARADADADEGGAEGGARAGAEPDPDADREPSHGVRRKLFTIRRHSGGKPPVAGVTTDGSAERRAAGRQGGPGEFGGGHGQHGGHAGGGRGRHGGGGRGHGGHGGQGGQGRPQHGRWQKRRRHR